MIVLFPQPYNQVKTKGGFSKKHVHSILVILRQNEQPCQYFRILGLYHFYIL